MRTVGGLLRPRPGLRRDVLGRFILPLRLRVVGWRTAAVTLLAAPGLFVTWGR